MESPTKPYGPSDEGKPLAIDLFCGLGGWTEGLSAEGFRVIGFDIEAHEYWMPEVEGSELKNPNMNFNEFNKSGKPSTPDWTRQYAKRVADLPRRLVRYPAQLVIQDVLTLHGSQFKDAALIVASPPCQEYSYMAMPWKLAKAKAAAIRADTTGEALFKLNRLFNACFRIQAEASLAAGRRIPMVVENVRGAQPWVGRAQWNFGSFYLWGDVPALMPIPVKGTKVPMPSGEDSLTIGFQQMAKLQMQEGVKATGMNWSDRTKRGQDFTRIAGQQATNGTKQGGDWFAEARKGGEGGTSASFGSKSPARRMASAMIAKIPLTLSHHIARVYRNAA